MWGTGKRNISIRNLNKSREEYLPTFLWRIVTKRQLAYSVGDPWHFGADPDPGGPKTCGSGSGSPTLLAYLLYLILLAKILKCSQRYKKLTEKKCKSEGNERKATCIGGAAEPVRDPLLRQVILQPAGVERQRLAPVVRPRVEQELPAARLVNERTDERPEDGKDARRADNEHAAQRLRIIGLADLDDVEEGLDAGPPQVPHVQALCKKSPAALCTWAHKGGGVLGYRILLHWI